MNNKSQHTVLCVPEFVITHSPITLSNLSSINLVPIFRCSSPPLNPVYTRRVDPSSLTFSLSSHRHSYLSLLFISRFSSLHNKQTVCMIPGIDYTLYLGKKIKEKHGVNDILKLDQHSLCMICYKNSDPEQRLKVTVKLGKDCSPTVMLEHFTSFNAVCHTDSDGWGRIWHAQESLSQRSQDSQNSQSSHHLGYKKNSKKVSTSLAAPVSSEVALDTLDLVMKVSPNYSLLLSTMSYWLFSVVKYRNVSWSHSSCSCTEVLKYRQHTTHTNPITFEDNPLSWWKTHGHHRTSGRWSEDIFESGHHDSSSLHTWCPPFGSKD